MSLRIIIPALVALVLIGIAIPKLTVHDAVTLTDAERSCVQAHERHSDIGLFWVRVLGKSAVVEKRGDGVIKPNTLLIKSYTIFRIPLPFTNLFNRFTTDVICDWAVTSTTPSPLSLPDLTLKGWYPHRESNISILFLRQETVPEIGMTEGYAYGEQIRVYALPIKTTPEEWVVERQLETDLANTYEWDFLNGRRHIRVTHPTPAADAQTDYFFGYGHVVVSMFYPVSTLKDDSLQRYDYDRFLYNSVAPLVDTAYSRDVLRQNCAQEVPTASIDDSSADPENHIATFHWWDGALQDNRKLDVLYEPETNFVGCSESVKSILEHVRDIDESNRENGFYD